MTKKFISKTTINKTIKERYSSINMFKLIGNEHPQVILFDLLKNKSKLVLPKYNNYQSILKNEFPTYIEITPKGELEQLFSEFEGGHISYSRYTEKLETLINIVCNNYYSNRYN